MKNSKILSYNSDDRVLGPREKARIQIMASRETYGTKISLIITDQCNISCAHCLPECTGKENKKLDTNLIFELLNEAKEKGLKTVCFTGGEPFLKFDTLKAGIRHAKTLGLETTVMSNGYWAKTVGHAKYVLQKLDGLTKIGLSTDVFHQPFVPIEKIINGVLAANELNLYCAVRLTHLNDPDREIEELQQQLSPVAGLYYLEHQPVQPLGRAETNIPYEKIYAYDVTLACCRSADVHAVNSSGDVTACCGATGEWKGEHPLKFGNVCDKPMGKILEEANKNPVLHAVRLWGSAGLMKIAIEEAKRQGIELKVPKISNLCELCRLVNTTEPYATFLRQGVENKTLARKIAVARLVELGETDLMK